ncbi:hypothetical protein ACFE04_028284 [Oxalis oulophora]
MVLKADKEVKVPPLLTNVDECNSPEKLFAACCEVNTYFSLFRDPVNVIVSSALYQSVQDEGVQGSISNALYEGTEVKTLRGLHVIGKSLHESRRIDNQGIFRSHEMLEETA